MAKNEKKHGFWSIIRDGLSYTYHILPGGIFPSIVEGVEIIAKNIDDRVVNVEKRLMKKMYTFSVICFGGLLLILALLFYLKESLNWSNTLAFFTIGITIFVVGLLLQIRGSDK